MEPLRTVSPRWVLHGSLLWLGWLALSAVAMPGHGSGGHAGIAHGAGGAGHAAPGFAAGGVPAGPARPGHGPGWHPGPGVWRGPWGHGYGGWGPYYGIGVFGDWPWWVPAAPVYDVSPLYPAEPLIETAPEPVVSYRFYCPAASAYYPDVPTCPVPWLRVVP